MEFWIKIKIHRNCNNWGYLKYLMFGDILDPSMENGVLLTRHDVLSLQDVAILTPPQSG